MEKSIVFLLKKEMSIWRKSVLYNKVPIFYLSYYLWAKRMKETKKVPLVMKISLYPALTGSNTPTPKFGESKEVRWEINCP